VSADGGGGAAIPGERQGVSPPSTLSPDAVITLAPSRFPGIAVTAAESRAGITRRADALPLAGALLRFLILNLV